MADERSTILVVDDEPLNRKLVRAILGADHTIVEAGDGESGIARVAAGDVDLVILDVQMPRMDGFEVCAQLKRDHATPYLPVLLLTALADKDSRLRGYEAGADDFLTKPIDQRELVLRTRAFLRLRFQDERIRAQLAELQRLDRLKDDLAGLVVHDMRNPLAGLDGLLYVLAQSTSGEHAEIVGEALDASRHLRGAVEDLLKVRMLEQHELVLARAPTDLREVAEGAAAALEGDAHARGLRIEVSGDPVAVPADGALLRRAIENLLANALRYTRPRTTVAVEIRADGLAGEVLVCDRGPGVPDDQKPSLFGKFRRAVDSAKRPQRAGTGLGLYLVKLAAEAHGGSVTVEDRTDGGAVFRIRLPKVAGD